MTHRRITVACLGSSDWPRFAIQRSRARYWTGRGWSHDLRDAWLFHDEQEALSQAIVMQDHIRPRRFVTTALIVLDDEPFTVKDLRKALEQSTVTLAVPEHAGLDDTYIEIDLDWTGLEEIQ
jgi:hypothetical protein